MNQVQAFEHAMAPAPRWPLARLLCVLRARLRRRELDAQLAEGRSPWSSGELTIRAVALSSLDERQRITSAIVALVRFAERRSDVPPGVRIRHAAVLDHRETLLGLAARLHAEEPVDVATVAQLAVLVWDRSSPVYKGGRPVEDVATIVHRCAAAAGGDFCSPR